jgi:antitoxin StbD
MAHQVLTNLAASITDLKKHPMQTVKSAHGEPLAILSHNEPVFYCVPAPVFEAMMEALDDIELKKIIAMRAAEKEIEVNIHDL